MADKALTEEVERLRKLEQEGIFSCSRHNKTDNEQLSTPHEAQTESEELCGRTHKRKRHSRSETEDMIIPCGNGHDTTMLGEPSKDLHKEAVSSGALLNNQQVSGCLTCYSSYTRRYGFLIFILVELFQPECCRRIINRSGVCLKLKFFTIFLTHYGHSLSYVLYMVQVVLWMTVSLLTACFNTLLRIWWAWNSPLLLKVKAYAFLLCTSQVVIVRLSERCFQFLEFWFSPSLFFLCFLFFLSSNAWMLYLWPYILIIPIVGFKSIFILMDNIILGGFPNSFSILRWWIYTL